MTAKNQKGFTLIELLIVIAVLGILAVAVLAAINPIEQINRSRDTGKRSDAEQLISAIDRFYASKGYYPWDSGPTLQNSFTTRTQFTELGPVRDADCTVLEVLSSGRDGNDACVGTEELKSSFVTRITALDANGEEKERPLYLLYDPDQVGGSVYVCFTPQSGSFKTEASTRCTDGLPADLHTMKTQICDVDSIDGETDVSLHCLP